MPAWLFEVVSIELLNIVFSLVERPLNRVSLRVSEMIRH
jgi:hypothetical protein